MVVGFKKSYALRFPDGTVRTRKDFGEAKRPGQVVTLDGKPWRVTQVLELSRGSADFELHLGTLKGYPVLLVTAGDERRVDGFFVYPGELPESDQVITVEDQLSPVTVRARVTRVESDTEFPIHATEEPGS